MKDKPIVLKLGGSVITKKEAPFVANEEAIRRLAEEVAEASVHKLVIVHGGGSFGHPLAKEYGIGLGYVSSFQLIGFSKVHQAMAALNKLVVEALVRCGIPATAIAPSSCTMTKGGRVKEMELRPLRHMLDLGLVPTLYGDVVIDLDAGFSILSGDLIASELAVRMSAERMIFGVDVDGVYTSDPKEDASARLLRRLTLKELKAMRYEIGGSKAVDVTGGMLNKVLTIMSAVEVGIPALVVNAAKPRRVYKALRGEEVIGTFIERG